MLCVFFINTLTLLHSDVILDGRYAFCAEDVYFYKKTYLHSSSLMFHTTKRYLTLIPPYGTKR